jgi:hypothetical protein
MARMNYNRPRGGYEMEPWDRRRFENQFRPSGIVQEIRSNPNFVRGKYLGKNIGSIVAQDPGYCDWVLANNPQGIVAQQIIKWFNRQHPDPASQIPSGRGRV